MLVDLGLLSKAGVKASGSRYERCLHDGVDVLVAIFSYEGVDRCCSLMGLFC